MLTPACPAGLATEIELTADHADMERGRISAISLFCVSYSAVLSAVGLTGPGAIPGAPLRAQRKRSASASVTEVPHFLNWLTAAAFPAGCVHASPDAP